MREDGTSVDKIVLTTNANFPTPQDNGPPESPQGSPAPDETPPTITVTAPVAGVAVGGTVAIQANVTDPSGVSQVGFFVDGFLLGTSGIPPYGVNWDTMTESDGLHTVDVVAVDGAGNSGTQSLSVIVDNAAPTISVTVPVAGAVVNGTLTIQADVTDANGVSHVDFSIDGNLLETRNTPPYDVIWDTTTETDGSHTVDVVAVDAVGNSVSQSVSVVVDNTAPTVTLIAPLDGALLSGTVTLAATAVDLGSGVEGVQFVLDNSILGQEDTTFPYTLSWDTTTVTLGAHILSALVRDAAENLALAPDVQVTVVASGGEFQQDAGPDGLVSLEAEHFHQNTAQGNHNWTVITNPTSYSGDSAMIATPNSGTNQNTNYVTNSPRLDFDVNFVHTGTHYVWIRGVGSTGTDDSLHVGFDGQALTSSDRISSLGTTWTWTNQTMDGVVATVEVGSVGIHTVNVWMREDGTSVDKIVLTTNANFPTPLDNGPPESLQGPPPLSHVFTVVTTGLGSIGSSPSGIACPGTCSSEFAEDLEVTLTAVPEAGWLFSGWSGAGCSGLGSCVVTIAPNLTVAAVFLPDTTDPEFANIPLPPIVVDEPFGPANLIPPIATDNSGIAPSVLLWSAPATFPLDIPTTVIWRAIDGAGNFSDAAQSVTVNSVQTSGNVVIGFILYDADTDQAIGPLTDGATVVLSGGNYNIEAIVADPEAATQSVGFSLSGATSVQRTESVDPYMLAADKNGDILPMTFNAGLHTLTATPYSGNRLTGAVGESLTIQFTVQ